MMFHFDIIFKIIELAAKNPPLDSTADLAQIKVKFGQIESRAWVVDSQQLTL